MTTQTAQSGHTNPPRLEPQARVNCFRCGQIGYITKDCTEKRHRCVNCFQCGGIRHITSKLSGKMSQGTRYQHCSAPWTRCEQGATNHLSTHWPNALLSSSWFRLLSHHSEHKAVLHLEREESKIMTINGKTQACCGVVSVRIHTDSGESAKVNVLVM